MSVVWVWTDKQEGLDKMVPDMEVWTIRANEQEGSLFASCDNQLADCAWTQRKEVYGHHWFEKGKPQPHILKMTLLEYIKLNLEEIRGMNPFWTVGRHNFLDAWTNIHGHEIDVAVSMARRLNRAV
jgi:hypothetical protein